MTIVAMDEARRREPKASYDVSDHVISQAMDVSKDLLMTYRRKHKTDDSAVSPDFSNPDQSRNESHTSGSCSHEIKDKHQVGSTLYSAYAVLNGRWPAQICKVDARLELVLDNGSRVKVKERRLVGAMGDIFRGLGR